MNEGSALILVAGPHKAQEAEPEYVLRFYEGATLKKRDLGTISFQSADLLQHQLSDGSWAFVLSSKDPQNPILIVADLNKIKGRIAGSVAVNLEPLSPCNDLLTYRVPGTPQIKTIALQALLGKDEATGIFESSLSPPGEQYLQFLPSGIAIVTGLNARPQSGNWFSDGYIMHVTLSDGSTLEIPRNTLSRVSGIPAGTHMVVRLLSPLASHSADEGDPVHAVLISTATYGGKILLPQGTEFSGTITQARGVGWAMRHETAALTLDFTSATLPGGQILPVKTRLFKVENSREKVDDNGTIQGIRSTGTPGHSAQSKISSVAAFNPIAFLFTTVSATAALGFAESEILYPAGTELVLEVTSPLITSKSYPSLVPALASSAEDWQNLSAFVKTLSYRTTTNITNKPSDLTNLVFIGSPEGLRRAFTAAGWGNVDQSSSLSSFNVLKTYVGTQPYNQAPMSTLLLDEKPPIFTLSKTTNTLSRHHLRVFDPQKSFNGSVVLTSSSTQDIGVTFSQKHKAFIHVIDQYIDNERAKVVDDLEFTGCVEALSLVPRPWAPKDAYNSTGDKLRTDGAIAVLRIGECKSPRTTPTGNAVPPSRFERITRDTMLTLRNDLLRGNLGYQGYIGMRWLKNYIATRNDLQPDLGAWRNFNTSGSGSNGVSGILTFLQPQPHTSLDPNEIRNTESLPRQQSHRWDPPSFEIGIDGSIFRYASIRTENTRVHLTSQSPSLPSYGLGLFNSLDGGWAAGLTFTQNSWRWVSNEFGYHYQHGSYTLGKVTAENGPSPAMNFSASKVGLNTREVSYNILIHARPPESRWRPYIAVGPALELLSLSEAPLKKASNAFMLGPQNLGFLVSVFATGDTPPLQGGALYAWGLNYGGGIKYRVLPRITVRADFSETWVKNPQFIKDSYTDDHSFLAGYTTRFSQGGAISRYRQQRFTLGASFTF